MLTTLPSSGCRPCRVARRGFPGDRKNNMRRTQHKVEHNVSTRGRFSLSNIPDQQQLLAMGPNRRAQERERAAARAAAEATRAEAESKAITEAQKIVAIWNARQAGGRALWFYPTIGAAIAAGLPWLTFSCPACQQVDAVDLRTLDRHRRASISSLIPSVSCRRCSPNAPFARLETLNAERA
jgi:hypothetical protein